MNKKRWIILLLLLLILWGIYKAEKALVTAAAVAATALYFMHAVYLWPVLVLGWLLHFFWASDFVRKLFGLGLRSTETLPNLTGE